MLMILGLHGALHQFSHCDRLILIIHTAFLSYYVFAPYTSHHYHGPRC